MRFLVAILSCLIFKITLTSMEETLSPYSVIDYRIPLRHPQLFAVVNQLAGMSHYLQKLNIDYPMYDLDTVRGTPVFKEWSQEFTVYKLYVRNMFACELVKHRVANMKFTYDDKVSDFGRTTCFNQCLAENEEFYKFLSSKLQTLTWNNPLIDVALNAPRKFFGEKQISRCTRVAPKRYRCDCFYRNYLIKVSPDFERLFGKILLEAREATSQTNADREELEETYGVPMELIGFLIVYHLMPDDMFTYLAWWTGSEAAAAAAAAKAATAPQVQ